MCPITLLVPNPLEKVSDLLLPAMEAWDAQLVRGIFLPIDAEVIMKIPICTRNTKDFWAWNPDKKGMFTVSSTYRFLVNTKFMREGWLHERAGSSSNEREEKDWTKFGDFQSHLKSEFSMAARPTLLTNNRHDEQEEQGNQGCMPVVWGCRTHGTMRLYHAPWQGVHGLLRSQS